MLAKNVYACFGDMNRMSSQWKRGGAFYCLLDTTLVAALSSIITSHDSCWFVIHTNYYILIWKYELSIKCWQDGLTVYCKNGCG